MQTKNNSYIFSAKKNHRYTSIWAEVIEIVNSKIKFNCMAVFELYLVWYILIHDILNFCTEFELTLPKYKKKLQTRQYLLTGQTLKVLSVLEKHYPITSQWQNWIIFIDIIAINWWDVEIKLRIKGEIGN